ncbi:hypothetical protein KI387_004848 [Taxus chinensis]|uniref:TauD/TfdA-like domain-containing protein n=1 Tax=Taxus chinensis TaxID=29808 RepID=A0AA38GMS3_TAXCH|nr:hypothetical protein KI387_004848 [Taxus chinensis]
MEKMHECPFQQGKIPQQQVIDEHGLLFPMILLPKESTEHCNSLQSFLHTIRNNRAWIDNQIKQVGALLFRGFSIKTAADFNVVVEAFGWEEQPYLGAASRTRIEGRVFTANEAPLHQPIKFHHEMSMFEYFPTKLVFFCEIAPPAGGQTPLLLSHKITERMEEIYPELVRKLEKEGLIYASILSEEDSPEDSITGWQSLYKTKDKEEAGRRASNSGLITSNVSWEGNNMLLQLGPLPCILEVDGDKKAWFNLLTFGDPEKPPLLGDGSEVPKEAIESCIQIAEEECVEVKWEVGDVIVIDNRFVMHARRPSKPPRRVLAAFCK